jgi:hypothetical protein
MMPYMTNYAPLGVPRGPVLVSTVRPSNDNDMPNITKIKNNHPVIPSSRQRQSTLNAFFVPKQFTPINQSTLLYRTPSPPQKHSLTTSSRLNSHDIRPQHLQFSPSPLSTSNNLMKSIAMTPKQATKQLKITNFCYIKPRSTTPSSSTPVIQYSRQLKTSLKNATLLDRNY